MDVLLWGLIWLQTLEKEALAVNEWMNEWMNDEWMNEWGGLSKWVFWPGMIDCTEKDYEIFNTYSIINY